MEYEIRVEDALPRQLAAVRGATSRAELPRTILKLLDTVWPVLRAQQAVTGHNVVVYFGASRTLKPGWKCSATSSTSATYAIRKRLLDRRSPPRTGAITPRWPARMPRFNGGVQRTGANRPGQAGRSTATGPTIPSSAEPISTSS